MSRFAIAIVLLVSFAPVAAHAADALLAHVRGLDAWARESIERGCKGSSAIRELVRLLDASDVIVHVETTTTLPPDLAGMTRFATAAYDYRYVRVTLDRDLSPDGRAATLAHELQHALELAHSGARSRSQMQDLFERIGYRSGGVRQYYDTVAAQDAGARAWAELRGYAAAAAQR